ncbi:MAG: hypothetical protein ACLFWD_00510 [Anaerolineales bacterium]
MRHLTQARYLPLLLLLVMLVNACAPAGLSEPTPTDQASATPAADPQPSASPTARPMETPPPQHIPPMRDLIVDKVVADLAARLEIPSSAVEVIDVEEMIWSDASLGCPRPGMMYVQVVTPGYRVVLEAEGQTYPYHTDERGRFVLCNEGEDPDRLIPYGEPLDPKGG